MFLLMNVLNRLPTAKRQYVNLIRLGHGVKRCGTELAGVSMVDEAADVVTNVGREADTRIVYFLPIYRLTYLSPGWIKLDLPGKLFLVSLILILVTNVQTMNISLITFNQYYFND